MKVAKRYEDKNGKTGTSTRRAARANSRGTADWATADSALLTATIARITFTGGAIRFGYTSDGGAYAVGIYGDGEPYTDYVRPDEDINEYLKELYASYGDDRR